MISNLKLEKTFGNEENSWAIGRDLGVIIIMKVVVEDKGPPREAVL